MEDTSSPWFSSYPTLVSVRPHSAGECEDEHGGGGDASVALNRQYPHSDSGFKLKPRIECRKQSLNHGGGGDVEDAEIGAPGDIPKCGTTFRIGPCSLSSQSFQAPLECETPSISTESLSEEETDDDYEVYEYVSVLEDHYSTRHPYQNRGRESGQNLIATLEEKETDLELYCGSPPKSFSQIQDFISQSTYDFYEMRRAVIHHMYRLGLTKEKPSKYTSSAEASENEDEYDAETPTNTPAVYGGFHQNFAGATHHDFPPMTARTPSTKAQDFVPILHGVDFVKEDPTEPAVVQSVKSPLPKSKPQPPRPSQPPPRPHVDRVRSDTSISNQLNHLKNTIIVKIHILRLRVRELYVNLNRLRERLQTSRRNQAAAAEPGPDGDTAPAPVGVIDESSQTNVKMVADKET